MVFGELSSSDGVNIFRVMGDGIITCTGANCIGWSVTWAESFYPVVESGKSLTYTIYLESYISEIKNAPEDHSRYIYDVYTTDELVEYLSLDVDMVRSYLENGVNIPSTVFNELAKHPKTRLEIRGLLGRTVEFRGDKITNPNASFTVGCEASNESDWNMVDTTLEDVVYINFAHSGAFPGPVKVEIGPFAVSGLYKCYYFNETTMKYERVADASVVEFGYLQFNVDCGGKYVVSTTELPAELVAEVGGNGSTPDGLWHEVKVDSLVWTEEDINSVLVAIEETKNDTSNKFLIVQVPSGSKVPAKIFEASNGIDICIKSADGIWATFAGGSYKAIDYVAGGTISNKAIDGMVNVGEDNIVYLSLKHEGQLPSLCEISYHGGSTMDGMGEALENLVEAKLYLFNKDAKKYELCGSGEMDLVVDYYCFTIDHCSSYVMSEESLPDEFVIASTTGENKEEAKTEETKKEDTTKAPGSIPYAGGTTAIMLTMVVIAVIGTIAFIKNKKLKGI